MKATVTCVGCCGRGVVPHTRRMIGLPPEMHPDPWDHQDEELCQRCNGTGKMEAPPPPDDTVATSRDFYVGYGAEGMC